MNIQVEDIPRPSVDRITKTYECTNLKRTLYLIDYERMVRMKELDIQRRQFLHNRLAGVPTSASAAKEDRASRDKREELRRRIQREKDAELRHQVSFLRRKVELMDNMKKTQKLSKSKSKEFRMLGLEPEVEEEEVIGNNENNTHNILPDYKLNTRSHIVNLYQRGFDVIKRQKEARQNPFVASVNTILHKLRAKTENADKDGEPFNLLSKTILDKFAGEGEGSRSKPDSAVADADADADEVKLDNGGVETTTETATSPVCDRPNPLNGESGEKSSQWNKDKDGMRMDNSLQDEDKGGQSHNLAEKPKYVNDVQSQGEAGKERNDKKRKSISQTPSRALRLWATVKREQNNAIRLSKQQEKQQQQRQQQNQPKRANQAKQKQAATLLVSANLTTDGNGNNSNSSSRDDQIIRRLSAPDARSSENKKPSPPCSSPTRGFKGQNWTVASKSDDGNTCTDDNSSPEIHNRRTLNKNNKSYESGEGASEQNSTPSKESPRKISSTILIANPSKFKKSKRGSRSARKDEIMITLTDACIEECNETNTPNTVNVVHDEGDDDVMTSPPQYWDKGYRYSLSPSDNEVIKDGSYQQSPDMGETTPGQDQKGVASSSERIGNSRPDDETTVLGLLDLNQISQAGRERSDTFPPCLKLKNRLSHRSSERRENSESGNHYIDHGGDSPENPINERSDFLEKPSLNVNGRGGGDGDVFLDNPLSGRSDFLESSAMSVHTPSETTTAGRSRSTSRLGMRDKSGSGGRRLSMQTRGSLRALSGVMKEDNDRQQKLENENILPESMAYRALSDALAGAAADADEQAQRLENIRRTGLGLRCADKETGAEGKFHSPSNEGKSERMGFRTMRRNTLSTPGHASLADVTDPVYKFLQRRTHSKTMRRHKTLSNVELKLLAHAPGEDIRRHSFSSLQSRRSSNSSRRSSSNSTMSMMTSMSTKSGSDHRMSIISSASRKTSSDLSAVPEVESVRSQSRNTACASARSRSRADSIGGSRPHSVAQSEDSKADSYSSNSNSHNLHGWRKEARSYSWAPDVSETSDWHVLAMELLASRGGSNASCANGAPKFRTVSHMLQFLGEEYKRQTAAMMYEELRYCSYLRLPKHQQPTEFTECDADTMFGSASPTEF